MDLTPISGKINTSPVTGSLPIFQLYVNELSVIQILAADWDYDQIVRCRWSYQYSLDECGSTCFDLPNSQLNSVDCAITWIPVLRSQDIANSLNESTYVVAITAEDSVNASSTIPLSSVPHQILVHVSYRPTDACWRRPSITGLYRHNLACYALSVGNAITFFILSTVTCRNDSIVEFISTSPFDIFKTDFYQESNYTWGVNITWTPLSDQIGLQPFCIAAIDNNGQTSNQYCVMIAVGATNPYIVAPTFVQGTASPLGTVMATQSRFSIQTSLSLRRTRLNGTKSSISIGLFCFQRYFVWRFTIWNPAISSTTTPSTTTTTATTHTVTTRFLGTTTYNTLYTTTGIPAHTTITTTTTTSATTTSATTTTTTSVTTTTTSTTTTTEYLPDVDVIYPKDMERACLQSVTIATALVTIATIPIHFFGMINIFVKIDAHYQKEILRARTARRKVLRQVYELEEQETIV
ncbi:unnamed protein product [Rotaria sp. Silwood1]|nr:unnamed protein product [Rotaria sp. Silwood1]CAF4916968.1 unnamed protein product [Rotaria sp. Silwood1]